MKVIITGTSGMVGKGVLMECLGHPKVSEVLSLGRSKVDIEHPKLKHLEHADFSEFESIGNELIGYDAAYLCMGVSAAGMDEQAYTRLTFDFTTSLVSVLYEVNPRMTITYVSGQGTDSTESGNKMWARVKGKTENAILGKGFKQAFMFRPGGIIPTRGIKPSSTLYRRALFWFGWILPILKAVAPNSIVNTDQIGKAMINLTRRGSSKKIIRPRDIIEFASAD